MKDSVRRRVIDSAMYIIQHDASIRSTAWKFGVSRNTIHTDLRERLPLISEDLYKKIDLILKRHTKEAPYRGGEAYKRRKLREKGL